MFDIG
jgi:hypothetical protein